MKVSQNAYLLRIINQIHLKKPLAVILSVCFWLLFIATIRARPALADLSLSPIYTDLSANQGKAESILTVGNTGDEAIRVRISATPFTYNKNGEFVRLSSNPQDLTPYLQYSPRELIVPPGKVRRVRLLTFLPPNLPPGEHRVAIFAETLSVNQQNGYRVNLISRLGAAIYVRHGDVMPKLVVQQAKFNAEQQQISLLLRNQGLATARTQISWSLKRGISEIVSASAGNSILPNSEVDVLLNRNNKNKLNLAPGTYQLSGEIAWQINQQKQTMPFNLDLVVEK